MRRINNAGDLSRLRVWVFAGTVAALTSAEIAKAHPPQGSIVGWGNNQCGQLNIPPPNTDFIAVAAGYKHSLGLKSNGSIIGWGCNFYGPLNVPAPNEGFIAIAGGGYHSLGLKADGSIAAWGCEDLWNVGQCNVPAPNSGFVAVAAGYVNSTGLKGDGSIVAWGAGTTSVPSPNIGFVAISASTSGYRLGLKAGGSIVAWGCEDIGGENSGQCDVPAPNNGFTAIAAGNYHSLGLKADGSIIAWGGNSQGQTNVPVPNTGFVAVAAGYYHSVGLKADGSIVAWGIPGQTEIPASNQRFVAITSTYAHSLAIQIPPESQLSVAPSQLAVARLPGYSLFAISNTGSGSMPWSVSTVLGNSWLRTDPNLSGVNGGIVVVHYDENFGRAQRTGTVRVSAPSAEPTFRDVNVVQAGTVPPPQVTHFEFSPITGPYNVNAPISVTLEARTANGSLATAFNAQVNMTASSGASVSPNKVSVSNGTWTGTVTVDQPHPNTQLTSVYNGITGTCSAFAVETASPAGGCINGFVFEGPASNPVQVSGADVSLYSLGGTLIFSQTTPGACLFAQSNPGKYCHCGIPVGDYLVSAEKAGKRSTRELVKIRRGETITHDPYLRYATKPPVLLVGGALGSTMSNTVGFYPILNGRSPVARETLKLHDPGVLGRPVWGDLRSTLEAHFTVIDVPWDWRFPIDDAAIETYLIPAIAEAKRLGDTPWGKVNVVAHSLGGILVRHYIQSNFYYANDIDRFAMVGTPNEGGAFVYYLWEGGDYLTADKIADANQHGVGVFAPNNFYRESVDNLYRGTHDGHMPPRCSFCAELGFASSHLSAQETWDVIHDYAQGVCDLLPTFSFLTNSSGVPIDFNATDCNRNLLSDLNDSPNAGRLVNEVGDPNKVRTKLFRSSGAWPNTPILTVSKIRIGGSGGNNLYPNGAPIDSMCIPGTCTSSGDGTVLTLSSTGITSNISDEHSFAESHAILMDSYRSKICQFLNDGVPCPTARRDADQAGEIVVRQTPAAVLEISLSGRVQPYLLGPNTLATGIRTNTGDLEQSIPSSSVTVFTGGAGLSVDDPVDGAYELSLTALPEEVFTVDVGYTDASGSQKVTWQGIHHDGMSSLTIVLDSGASPSLQVQGTVGLPVNLRAEQVDGLAQIAWGVSPDPEVMGYNVYGHPEDQPKFTLLGSTTGTTFDTTHPWVSQGVGALWTYFVVAKTADGTESLFNTVIENRNSLIAAMRADVTNGNEPLIVNFADASAGDVTSWAWDFDSDGTIDSTEQNPTHTFCPSGSYTVTLNVGGPEGTDTSIRVGLITVASGGGDLNADASGLNKSRIISLSVPGCGTESALRVKLTSLHHVSPPYTGGASVPFTSFEGQVRWVGPPGQYVESSSNPTPFYAASLQCAPHYQDWSTVGLVHVTGSAIVPSSVYEVVNVAASCQGNEANCTAVSAPLTVATTRWADVELPYNPPSTATQPDFADVSALVNKFKSLAGAPIKARALLAGDDAFGDVSANTMSVDFSFTHIAACVDAFRGKPYPYAIQACP